MRLRLRVGERHAERCLPDQPGKLAVHALQTPVLCRLDRRPGNAVGGGKPGLLLDRVQHQQALVGVEQIDFEAVAVFSGGTVSEACQQRVDAGDPILQQTGLLDEGNGAVAVGRLQRCLPALGTGAAGG